MLLLGNIKLISKKHILQILLLWCISQGLPTLACSAGILNGNCTNTELVAYRNRVRHSLISCCRKVPGPWSVAFLPLCPTELF